MRFLNGYANNQNASIGKQSVSQLVELVSCIDEFVQNVPIIIDPPNEIDVDFLNGLNEQLYEMRHYITCRLCNVSLTTINESFFPNGFAK